jgi:putative transposase
VDRRPYVKVREAGRIVSVAVTLAVAVSTDGRREVLSMAIGASEAKIFWVDFLRKLKRRGLAGVKLAISGRGHARSPERPAPGDARC